MSDFYDKVNKLDNLSGDELDRYYDGKETNKKVIMFFIVIPMFVIFIISSIIFFIDKTTKKENLIMEVGNINMVHSIIYNEVDLYADTLPEVEEGDEFDVQLDINRHLRIMKDSNFSKFEKTFSGFNVKKEGLFNSWGGLVTIGGKYPEGFILTYYKVPKGNHCNYLIKSQKNGDWKYITFDDYTKGERNIINDMSNAKITKLCRDFESITFSN